MNEEMRELGRHALGLPNKRRESYRNHFCAGIDHSDYPHWERMVENGYAKKFMPGQISGGDYTFSMTQFGAELCLKQNERLSKQDFPVAKKPEPRP